MTTMNVKDAAGSTVAVEKPLAPGRAAAASSRPVVLSTEDLAALSAPTVTIASASLQDTFGEYETVAASQTDQVLGATGASGDYLAGVLIVPATSAAGAVSIKDGSGSSITIFAGGGTTALPTLAPIFVPLGIYSTSGAWKLTTGANVTAIGVGKFT